MRFIIYNCFQR